MFDPLKLANQSKYILKLQVAHLDELLVCTKVHNIEHGNSKIARYQLQNIENKNEFMLEIYKDSAQDFHMQCYELLEKKPFNLTFASILGTDSIGYQTGCDKTTEPVVYQRLLHQDEKLDIYKYIADTDDYDKHASVYGYEQDAYGNWYMLLEKSDGNIKKFSNEHILRSWEYKQENNQRLLIELDETCQKQERYFDIFHGIKLTRHDIEIMSIGANNIPGILQNMLTESKDAYTVV